MKERVVGQGRRTEYGFVLKLFYKWLYMLSDNRGLHRNGTFSPELTRVVPLFKGHAGLSFQTLNNAAPIILTYRKG
jgi:hypothetical protein